jgi:hypothetical protein
VDFDLLGTHFERDLEAVRVQLSPLVRWQVVYKRLVWKTHDVVEV